MTGLGTVFTGELEILVSMILFYSFYSVLHRIEFQRKSGHSTSRMNVFGAIGVTRLVSRGHVTRPLNHLPFRENRGKTPVFEQGSQTLFEAPL